MPPFERRAHHLPPAFTSNGPFHHGAPPSVGYGHPSPSVELAPEVRADAYRYGSGPGTPYPPHSLSPMAMGAYGAANQTGPHLTQTVSTRPRPSLVSGVLILLAGVIAGGSFGVAMKAQQDRAMAVAAARAQEVAEPVEAPPAAAPMAAPGVNTVPAVPTTQTPIPSPPPVATAATLGGGVVPAFEGTVAPTAAPAPAPFAPVVIAPHGRGRVAPAAPARVATRRAEPAPAPAPVRAAKPEPPAAAPAGGIRTVRISAPASAPEPAEAPPPKVTRTTKAAPPPPSAPEKPAAPAKPARSGKSTDDLLEEAIKNTSNVL